MIEVAILFKGYQVHQLFSGRRALVLPDSMQRLSLKHANEKQAQEIDPKPQQPLV
jgi:hypothetical protein